MPPVRHDVETFKRSHQACINCKRKKVRCPGEKPFCSSCTRLNQNCAYRIAEKPGTGRTPVEERLANVEQQLNRILNEQHPHKNNDNLPEDNEPLMPDDSPRINHDESRSPPTDSLRNAIDTYFNFCHGQPIFCLDRRIVQDIGALSEELTHSLLALTCLFVPDLGIQKSHLNRARTAIMLRIANGSVDLSILQSLCLISYSLFINGEFDLGRFHVGLGSQLCRSAMLDLQIAYSIDESASEAKKRLFWSFQVLEQTYGSQLGLLQVPSQTWQVFFDSSESSSQRPDSSMHDSIRPPTLTSNVTIRTEIWEHIVQLGWIWNRVRRYVLDAALNRIKEPWRQDSQYTEIQSDLMQLETRIPLCHRYDTVKFYHREPQKLKENRDYWLPWLRLQFTYHAIHTMLNHPFLYISVSQHNSTFSALNSFWRKSSEYALSHATWIARMVDMVTDKEIQPSDIFFAHATAIAATVHLYYCCAASPKLKLKSRADLAKCCTFLKSFTVYSALCRSLDTKLRSLIQIASGSEDVDLTQWAPSKIYLNSNLMWDILGLIHDTDGSSAPIIGLLHQSLRPAVKQKFESQATFEITVATSPEVTVEVHDSGQAAPGTSGATNFTPSNSALETVRNDIVVVPSESLESLQAKPAWLWQDLAGLPDAMSPNGENFTNAVFDNTWDLAWWDYGNL